MQDFQSRMENLQTELFSLRNVSSLFISSSKANITNKILASYGDLHFVADLFMEIFEKVRLA